MDRLGVAEKLEGDEPPCARDVELSDRVGVPFDRAEDDTVETPDILQLVRDAFRLGETSRAKPWAPLPSSSDVRSADAIDRLVTITLSPPALRSFASSSPIPLEPPTIRSGACRPVRALEMPRPRGD
jgi:hypothetical protein